jgi:acetyl-CoA C-acetyltransferase
MPEAYIYDAVRTPRGKGKSSGALHEITALSLGTQVLQAIRDRNSLDTSKVDDVVFGCVSPVGEQGGDIARIAVLNADYAETTAGVQVDRFCASGLEACNMAASKEMTGEADMAIGGGVLPWKPALPGVGHELAGWPECIAPGVEVACESAPGCKFPLGFRRKP